MFKAAELIATSGDEAIKYTIQIPPSESSHTHAY